MKALIGTISKKYENSSPTVMGIGLFAFSSVLTAGWLWVLANSGL